MAQKKKEIKAEGGTIFACSGFQKLAGHQSLSKK
jgi:hypothetical protein